MDIQQGGSQKEKSKYPILKLMCRKQKNVIDNIICKAEIETQKTNMNNKPIKNKINLKNKNLWMSDSIYYSKIIKFFTLLWMVTKTSAINEQNAVGSWTQVAKPRTGIELKVSTHTLASKKRSPTMVNGTLFWKQ